MTKKDYVKIAAAINGSTVMMPPKHWVLTEQELEGFMAGAKDQLQITANHIANMLIQDNPRFDRARFLGACGL